MCRSILRWARQSVPILLVTSLSVTATLVQAQPAEPTAAADSSAAVDDELARLLARANQAASPGDADEDSEERSFIARGLGLQELNPEISAAGDFLATALGRESERSRTDFFFRVLDFHVESYLDPYSKMRVAVGVNPSGAALGEAYATRFGLLPRMNATAGKFRQQFGVVNRWHKHALDQIDFPLPLTRIFGPGGLNQTGFSLEWNLPLLWGATQGAMAQLTEGENPRIFAQNSRQLPSILVRYTNYRDLSKNTYLDLGVTGLAGWNDSWPIGSSGATANETRPTRVLGADLSLRWEPTDNMRYASFEWRTEFYHLAKEILAPDGTGRDRIVAWGTYTSLQRQLSRSVEVGLRFDYYRPDTKPYAGPETYEPLAVAGEDAYRWQVGPYLTVWQSPFVKIRFEADYADGKNTEPSELLVALQTVFAAGPHKHERY